ncbi:MAG: hypothetical protein ABJB47_09945 [Actinomycetota bacterium]
MTTESTGMFLMLSTVLTIALVVAGTGASALWFLYVLRRLGLRLRFAQARARKAELSARFGNGSCSSRRSPGQGT